MKTESQPGFGWQKQPPHPQIPGLVFLQSSVCGSLAVSLGLTDVCPFSLQALVSLHSHKDSLLPGAERLRNGDPESLSELPVARTLCQPSEVKIFLSHVAQISPLVGWLVRAAGRAEIRGSGGMICLGVQ